MRGHDTPGAGLSEYPTGTVLRVRHAADDLGIGTLDGDGGRLTHAT